ncbi:MAG: molybdenum cofactor guanylyltransferase [Thermoleophilia bacterium]|nr:molybdenum cofactor guanylyltransferase [Thermoleophilia bacterium]
MDSRRPHCGVILAGGRSVRLGTPKCAVTLDGEPLLVHVGRAMRAAGLEVHVVAKSASTLPNHPYRVLAEPDLPVHPVCGIASSLERLAEPVVVCPCDMPSVPPRLLRMLAVSPPSLATVVRHGGVIQPLLGRYTPASVPVLLGILEEAGPARAVVDRLGPDAHVIDVDDLPWMIDATALDDIDTPGDLVRVSGARQASRRQVDAPVD